jgi:DNA-directed RNA polymerase specialized sigma subunit
MRRVGGKYRGYAEACVVSLPLLLGDLKIKKSELEALTTNDGIRSINWDKVGHSSTISDLTGRTAIDNLEQKEELLDEIKKLDRKINKIAEAISALPKPQNTIIVSYYIDGEDWATVAGSVDYSIVHAQRFRLRALESIARALYGLKAVEDVKFLEIL